MQRRPLGRWLLALCALLSVAPLFARRHLPFTDLPEHVAAMSTLRHWFDPAWPDARIYELSGRGSPYLAYHVLGALLTVVTGDALRANLVLMAVTGLALPFATRGLLLATGGDERLALLSCATFWCRPLVLGLLPFMAAVPVALFALALVLRQHEAPTRRRWFALALLVLLLFYLHLDPVLLVVTVAVAVELVDPGPSGEVSVVRRVRRLPLRLAWLAPTCAAALLWIVRATSDAGAQFMGEGTLRFDRPANLADEFATWTQGIWRDRVSATAGTVTWLLVAVLALGRSPERGGLRAVMLRAVPFACAAVLFALVPSQMGVTSLLNVRLAVFLLPCALLLPRPDPGRVTNGVLGVAALVACVVSVEAVRQVRAADRDEAGGIDALLALVPPGARLLTLDFVTRSAHVAVPPWIHLGALHRLRGGGVASVSFSEVPHWPLPFRPGTRPPSIPGRSLEWQGCRFRNSFDGPYFDDVLVRGNVDPFRGDPPGPRWRRVGESLAWTLYEKVPGNDVAATRPDVGPCPHDLLAR